MGHYKNLGVNPDAPDEVVRAAYRALANKYHPDKNPGSTTATAKMKQLNASFEVLSDPEKRRVYDDSLRARNILRNNARSEPLKTSPSSRASQSQPQSQPKPVAKQPTQTNIGYGIVRWGTMIVTALSVRFCVSSIFEPSHTSNTSAVPSTTTEYVARPAPQVLKPPPRTCTTCIECQALLVDIGYNAGGIDGICGPLTIAAWNTCYANGQCTNPWKE